MKPKRVLPADVYDTLELSALAHGGIGRYQMFENFDWENGRPVCALGHLAFAEDAPVSMRGPAQDALFWIGIDGSINDVVFGDDEDRITFKQWCRRLNVVRGA